MIDTQWNFLENQNCWRRYVSIDGIAIGLSIHLEFGPTYYARVNETDVSEVMHDTVEAAAEEAEGAAIEHLFELIDHINSNKLKGLIK